MMQINLFRRAWIEFQVSLVELEASASPVELLNFILLWMKKYSDLFQYPPFTTYNFKEFLTLNVVDYPAQYSNMKGKELIAFKNNALRYQPKDIKSVAQFLRDTIEDLIVVKVSENCLRCGHFELGIYIQKNISSLVKECAQCGQSYTLDGYLTNADISYAKNSEITRFLSHNNLAVND